MDAVEDAVCNRRQYAEPGNFAMVAKISLGLRKFFILNWFGVPQNRIAVQYFLLFVLIFSISIISVIFRKFLNLAVFHY